MSDIIQLFSETFQDNNIQIYGTIEEPLFKAVEIGSLLGFGNIRDRIKDFDNTQRKDCVSISDAMGRTRETTMLTEKGLYKLAFTSTKPIALLFQNWVCDVLQKIRLTGKYELQKTIDDMQIEHEQHLIEFGKTSQKDKEMALLKERASTLLDTYKNKATPGYYLGVVVKNNVIVC